MTVDGRKAAQVLDHGLRVRLPGKRAIDVNVMTRGFEVGVRGGHADRPDD